MDACNQSIMPSSFAVLKMASQLRCGGDSVLLWSISRAIVSYTRLTCVLKAQSLLSV